MRGNQVKTTMAVTLAVVCALVSLTLAGCTTARNTLGTNASPCFEALAVAEDAVHDNGRLAGVHLESMADAGADLHLRRDLAARAGPAVHDVCVVSYRGVYGAGQVQRPLGALPPGGIGHYAIILVSKPQNKLLGTVLRLTQPLRFGHPV
jgi:hypothetical protein